MNTYEEFREDILLKVECCPKEWRKGQAVFNVVDCEYGVARSVQFNDGIDCFYDDTRIEEFLKAAWKKYDYSKNRERD